MEVGEADLPPDLVGDLGEIAGRPLFRLFGQVAYVQPRCQPRPCGTQWTMTLFCLAMRRVRTSVVPLAHCWPGPRSSDEMRWIAG